MKIKKSRSKSPLFLMEMTIVILFFSLSAAICMKVFSAAKVRTDFARNMTNASFAAESIAECFKADYEDGKSFSGIYRHSSEKDGVITVYFGSDWTESDEKDAVYRATVSKTEEKYIARAEINVYDAQDRELYSLSCAAGRNGGTD